MYQSLSVALALKIPPVPGQLDNINFYRPLVQCGIYQLPFHFQGGVRQGLGPFQLDSTPEKGN